MKKELICIVCPQGCHLTVEEKNGEFFVSGNKCPRGEVYAKEELTDPKRVVTAVAETDSKDFPRIPVKTCNAISKGIINDVLREIYSHKVKLPVKRGGIFIKDILSSGTDVVFTRSSGSTPEQYKGSS